jgi:hypothetical protein
LTLTANKQLKCQCVKSAGRMSGQTRPDGFDNGRWL